MLLLSMQINRSRHTSNKPANFPGTFYDDGLETPFSAHTTKAPDGRDTSRLSLTRPLIPTNHRFLSVFLHGEIRHNRVAGWANRWLLNDCRPAAYQQDQEAAQTQTHKPPRDCGGRQSFVVGDAVSTFGFRLLWQSPMSHIPHTTSDP